MMRTLDEMRAIRKEFEAWIKDLRINRWGWAHDHLEHQEDPSPPEWKGKLGKYDFKETAYLFDLWLYDKEKLKYIYSQMDHKSDYRKEYRNEDQGI